MQGRQRPNSPPSEEAGIDTSGSALDKADLETTLRVLATLPDLDPDDPAIQAVKRASSRMYKHIRKARRREARRPDIESRACTPPA